MPRSARSRSTSGASRSRCSLPALIVLVADDDRAARLPGVDEPERIDLSMPWLSGFAGLDNYAKMGSDPRFWSSLALTFIYTASTVVLQVAIGLALALLVLRIPKRTGCDAGRGDPADRARAGRRRSVLAHAGALRPMSGSSTC